MPGNVSKGCAFPNATAVIPYGAAFIGMSRTEAAKNHMCYFGPRNVINPKFKTYKFSKLKKSFLISSFQKDCTFIIHGSTG